MGSLTLNSTVLKMNILYWDVENLRNIDTSELFPEIKFDIVHCVYAEPIENIKNRIKPSPSILRFHYLEGRGPNLSDTHILSQLHLDIEKLGIQHQFFLASKDKLLSYRFNTLASNSGVKPLNTHALYNPNEIRVRSNRGRKLYSVEENMYAIEVSGKEGEF